MDRGRRAPPFLSCCKGDILTDMVLSLSKRLLLTPPLPLFLLPFQSGSEQRQTSGPTVKHMTNIGAGLVDADYRGPVGVVLFNFSPVDFVVEAEDCIT